MLGVALAYYDYLGVLAQGFGGEAAYLDEV